MKRIIFQVLMFALCVNISAQNQHSHSGCTEDSINPTKEAILSEITVTGLTGTKRMKDSPIAFAVISPQKLHQSMGTNIVDVIAHQPGLAQISTGAGISKPVIRGLGYNRVVVVEQGIRQEGQQWGDEHGLEVDAEGVHSVEILKGPASLMYGSDAIAGVMILHPEHALPYNTMQVKVGGEYQSNNGLYNYHVGFAGNMNGWLWNWHFNDKAAHCYKNARDGYVPGSWYKERDIQGMLGVNKSWGHSWLRFSHVDFTPGITESPHRIPEGSEIVWEEGQNAKSYAKQLPSQRVLHTKVVSDNAFNIGTGTLKAIIGYQQNYRREFECEEETLEQLNLKDLEPSLSMRLHTVNYDVRYQLPLQNDWNIATGVNGMWQQNKNEAEEMLIPDYELFDFGYFLTADKMIGRWHLSGGARIDNRHLVPSNSTKGESEDTKEIPLTADASEVSSPRGSWWGASGSLGAVYNVNERMNMRLNIARGFRAPTVSELCSNGVHEGSIQYELGNGNLKSEFSTQIDLGMDYNSHYVSVAASLFTNWISNYIFLGRLPFETKGYRTYQYRQGDAILMGGELAVDVHPINALHFENTFSYVRGRQLSSPSGDVEGGYNLPMMPAPRWTCNLQYDFPAFAHGHCQRPYVSAGMEYNFRQNHFYALDDTETATPDYALFNLSAGMDIHIFGHNCIELSVVCQNLFNKVYQSHLSRLKYADTLGISGIGRNLCIKVNIPIDIHLKR